MAPTSVHGPRILASVIGHVVSEPRPVSFVFAFSRDACLCDFGIVPSRTGHHHRNKARRKRDASSSFTQITKYFRLREYTRFSGLSKAFRNIKRRRWPQATAADVNVKLKVVLKYTSTMQVLTPTGKRSKAGYSALMNPSWQVLCSFAGASLEVNEGFRGS